MYPFALKIIFAILNKSTQYISFIAISLFLTFFLLTKEGLVIYEDIFINSLKGLYPEFVTNSLSTIESLKAKNVEITKEIFVYSEEIIFSYGDDEDISKFMNVRTFNAKHKDELFSTIEVLDGCTQNSQTIWLSQRLYNNMLQDGAFDTKHLFFIDNDDEYVSYDICVFALANDEKWLVTSTQNAKDISYMPLPTNTIYTNDKELKLQLYKMKKVNNWKKYIDYEDLGIFLLAKEVSKSFLIAFFIFLVIFMIITFSSLAKEFEASIFLKKMFGMSLMDTIGLFTLFFFIYVSALMVCVVLEYTLVSVVIENILDVVIPLNLQDIGMIFVALVVTGGVVSSFVSKKYHRLPL